MRKKKAIFNMAGSLGSYSVSMIFTFITQAVIVKILGIEYSGVNGLFTNILTMLSVAELGLSTTIIYKLYEPLAKNDIESIKSWLNFYKICYRIVAGVVLIIGLVIIPVVPLIVGKVTIQDNIILLYLIALLDTVLSYIMTYKRSLLYADQKNYIINFVHILYILFMNITQIILLYVTKSYIVFLVIKLIYRLLENIILNIYVDKHYSYVNDNFSKIDKNEKDDFFKRIKAMFLQKVSFVVNKGIDSITISYFLGVAAVGYYTNYNLIATALSGIIFQIISGLNASVGNLLTEHNEKKSYSIYKKINYLNSIFTGICIAGFVCCIQSFIKIWIGENYFLNIEVIASFGVYIYADSIRRSITIFKEAAGICREDQIMYIIMAIINLASSIILCKILGIAGVILGTALSYLFLIFYSYPKYIFQNVFKEKKSKYYIETTKYCLIIILGTLVSYYASTKINFLNNLLDLIVKGILSIFIMTVIFWIFTFKSEELNYYKTIIKSFFKKKRIHDLYGKS